jgi:hypothetical protein
MIQQASANLITESSLVSITGFVYYQQGYIDSETNTVRAFSIGAWQDLTDSTWDDYQSYTQTANNIIWTADIIDLGLIDYFTLDIQTQASGPVELLIHVSDTGEFAGEEREYLLNQTANIPAFRGQYAAITVRAQAQSLERFDINTSRQTQEIELRDINTALLPGTVTDRQLPIGAASQIIDIFIQPKAVPSYAVNLYVSAQPVSEIVIPVVKDKNLGTIALYGIDNDPRDAVIDARIKIMPLQRFFNGNLVVVI